MPVNYFLDSDWDTNFDSVSKSSTRDHVRVECSSCGFPWEFVSFVRPGELVSEFDSSRGLWSFLCPTLASCWSIHLTQKCICFYFHVPEVRSNWILVIQSSFTSALKMLSIATFYLVPKLYTSDITTLSGILLQPFVRIYILLHNFKRN